MRVKTKGLSIVISELKLDKEIDLNNTILLLPKNIECTMKKA